MQIRWDVHPGTGPYLLLVHGFLTGPTQWLLNLEALDDASGLARRLAKH